MDVQTPAELIAALEAPVVEEHRGADEFDIVTPTYEDGGVGYGHLTAWSVEPKQAAHVTANPDSVCVLEISGQRWYIAAKAGAGQHGPCVVIVTGQQDEGNRRVRSGHILWSRHAPDLAAVATRAFAELLVRHGVPYAVGDGRKALFVPYLRFDDIVGIDPADVTRTVIERLDIPSGPGIESGVEFIADYGDSERALRVAWLYVIDLASYRAEVQGGRAGSDAGNYGPA